MPAWNPSPPLQPHEDLAASTDKIAATHVGGPADLVLLEEDVFEDVPGGAADLMDEAAAQLRTVAPLASQVVDALESQR